MRTTVILQDSLIKWIRRMVIAVVFVLAGGMVPARGETSPAGGGGALAVAAAANLKSALDGIIQAFTNANPGVTVTVTYGASGNAYAQIVNHAPFDLFLSADTVYPRKLVDQGFAEPGGEFEYAVGRLVVWTVKESALDPATLGIKALADPSVRHVSIADPAKAPYGRAAEQAMKTLEVYDAVKGKLVKGDNVMQAGQFLESKAADIGLIPLSLALAPSYKAKGKYAVVPAEAHSPIIQSGVVLKTAKDRAWAQAFRKFLLEDAKATGMLKAYGYELPRSAKP